MILKLAGSKSVRDFTLLGECFSVEIEHIPEDQMTKPGAPGVTPVPIPPALPVSAGLERVPEDQAKKSPAIPVPIPLAMREGCNYRRAHNGMLAAASQWKRATLADIHGRTFMIVDFSGTAYVMNDSGKTIDSVH